MFGRNVAVDKPEYEHQCEDCKFLMNVFDESGRNYDVYIHDGKMLVMHTGGKEHGKFCGMNTIITTALFASDDPMANLLYTLIANGVLKLDVTEG